MRLQKVFQDVVDFILFGNFLISFFAVTLLYTTYYYAGIPIRLDTLGLFVFAATFFQYNFHRFYTTRKYKDEHPIVVWSRKHPFVLIMFCIISGGAAAILLFPLQRSVINALVPLVLMSLFYEIPLINSKGQRVRLRNIWFFKTILLVLTWTFTTVLLPYLQYDLNIYSTEFALLFIKRLLLISAIAILFDIRDFDYDKVENVRTVPVMFGIMRSRRIIFTLCMFIGLVGIAFVFLSDEFRLSYLITAITFPALTYYIISRSIRYPSDYFYSSFVDGILGLELLLLYATTWCDRLI
jgi:4-hydroxybenzoate polyprenyltransferase